MSIFAAPERSKLQEAGRAERRAAMAKASGARVKASNAKLTSAELVRWLKKSGGASVRDLEAKYGASAAHIRKVLKGLGDSVASRPGAVKQHKRYTTTTTSTRSSEWYMVEFGGMTMEFTADQIMEARQRMGLEPTRPGRGPKIEPTPTILEEEAEGAYERGLVAAESGLMMALKGVKKARAEHHVEDLKKARKLVGNLLRYSQTDRQK